MPGYLALDDTLALPELDAVIVITYHPSHAFIAIHCMRAGKNVVIEKPYATSSAEAREVARVAKE